MNDPESIQLKETSPLLTRPTLPPLPYTPTIPLVVPLTPMVFSNTLTRMWSVRAPAWSLKSHPSLCFPLVTVFQRRPSRPLDALLFPPLAGLAYFISNAVRAWNEDLILLWAPFALLTPGVDSPSPFLVCFSPPLSRCVTINTPGGPPIVHSRLPAPGEITF